MASRLSGGDYDGDRVSGACARNGLTGQLTRFGTVIWQREIVEAFENADIAMCDPPFKLGDVFDADTRTIGDLYAELDRVGEAEAEAKLLEVFAAPMRVKSLTGDCASSLLRLPRQLPPTMCTDSKMHFCQAYRHTPADKTALELAHKAALCLDSAKSGLTLKPAIVSADRKLLDKLGEPRVRVALWPSAAKVRAVAQIWATIKDHNMTSSNGGRLLERPRYLPRHILDSIDRAADAFLVERKNQFKLLRDEVTYAAKYREDYDLSERWRTRERDLEACDDEMADLNLIRDAILDLLDAHVRAEERAAAQRGRKADAPMGSPTKNLSPRKQGSGSTTGSGTSVETGSISGSGTSIEGEAPLSHRQISQRYRATQHNVRSKLASRVYKTMPDADLALLWASAAYALSYKTAFGRAFVYDVAFTELCHLKAEKRSTAGVRSIVDDCWAGLKSDKVRTRLASLAMPFDVRRSASLFDIFAVRGLSKTSLY